MALGRAIGMDGEEERGLGPAGNGHAFGQGHEDITFTGEDDAGAAAGLQLAAQLLRHGQDDALFLGAGGADGAVL